jgi:c(7)-type cytochrome triheme protein
MKRIAALVLAVVMTFALAGSVFAVGPGKKIEFPDGAEGKVTFSGDTHKQFKCNECHPALFKMKKGADKITMKEMNEGKNCGHCHNGTKAFSTKEKADCGKCHKK